jgi:hypothetical protein
VTRRMVAHRDLFGGEELQSVRRPMAARLSTQQELTDDREEDLTVEWTDMSRLFDCRKHINATIVRVQL